MIVEFNKENRQLTFKLTEDVDQHTVEKVRRKMDNEIKGYSPRKVVFDFSNMDIVQEKLYLILVTYLLWIVLG